MWKCSVCNYLHEGEGAPEKCPKCGAPQEKFNQLEADKAKLVERSRFSNGLLMDLIGLLEGIEEMSEQGIEDNLDPGCVKLYTEVKEFAAFARQSAKAEIENHMGKGKWG